MTRQKPDDGINFIPNDPLELDDAPMRNAAPHAQQKGEVARFAFSAHSAAAAYQPGTTEFLFWQTRQAALSTLDAFAACAGPLPAWASEVGDRLALIPDAGDDLNAYYDRSRLCFFVDKTGERITCTGASTDIVSHETGHAILDSLRPDLWDSPLPEHGAFHESFGDCTAILTALNDEAIRQTLVEKAGGVDAANFVESLAEELSQAVRRILGSKHPASQPRHALNSFQWQLPSSLPVSGGPSVLTGEPHSFGRIFTGCFYDTIRNIFASQPDKTAASLGEAARLAGRLLIEGARNAIERVRLFEEVGIAMLLADQRIHAGANATAIRHAFEAHGIILTTTPRIHHQLALADGIGGKLLQRRDVSLSGLDPSLEDVVAEAVEVIPLSVAAEYAAQPTFATTEQEVRFFVATLLASGSVSVTIASLIDPPRHPHGFVTHTVQVTGTRRVLRRIRFLLTASS